MHSSHIFCEQMNPIFRIANTENVDKHLTVNETTLVLRHLAIRAISSVLKCQITSPCQEAEFNESFQITEFRKLLSNIMK